MGDETKFVRELVGKTIRGIVYHGEKLAVEQAILGFARELLKRAGFEHTTTTYDETRIDDEEFDDIEDYAAGILRHCLWSVDWHEQQLKHEHDNMAAITVVVARGKYTGIDIAEIERTVRAEMHDNQN